jgi:phosphatidate cytidylyltransferase
MEKIFRTDITGKRELLFVVALIFAILIFATLLFFIIGKINPNAKLGEVKARTKSWWVMATVFIGLHW